MLPSFLLPTSSSAAKNEQEVEVVIIISIKKTPWSYKYTTTWSSKSTDWTINCTNTILYAKFPSLPILRTFFGTVVPTFDSPTIDYWLILWTAGGHQWLWDATEVPSGNGQWSVELRVSRFGHGLASHSWMRVRTGSGRSPCLVTAYPNENCMVVPSGFIAHRSSVTINFYAIPVIKMERTYWLVPHMRKLNTT